MQSLHSSYPLSPPTSTTSPPDETSTSGNLSISVQDISLCKARCTTKIVLGSFCLFWRVPRVRQIAELDLHGWVLSNDWMRGVRVRVRAGGNTCRATFLFPSRWTTRLISHHWTDVPRAGTHSIHHTSHGVISTSTEHQQIDACF